MVIRNWTVVAALCLLPAVAHADEAATAEPRDVRTIFEEKCAEIDRERHKRSQEWSPSSDLGLDTERYYKPIALLGPAVVPLTVEKLEKGKNCCVPASLVLTITQKRFAGKRETWFDDQRIIHWWRVGRRSAPAEFRANYRLWKQAKKVTPFLTRGGLFFDDSRKVLDHDCGSEVTELGKAYYAMLGLGIDILPLIVEEFERGDYDLYPLFWMVLNDAYRAIHSPVRAKLKMPSEEMPSADSPIEERIRRTLDWWEKNKEYWLLPPPEGMGKDWYLQKPDEETKADAPHVKKGENKGAGARKDEKAEPKPGAEVFSDVVDGVE